MVHMFQLTGVTVLQFIPNSYISRSLYETCLSDLFPNSKKAVNVKYSDCVWQTRFFFMYVM